MKFFTLALTLAAALGALGALGACKAKPEDKPPDNTAQNQRDKAAVPTADQAGQNKSDVSVAADVRKSLMNDSSLSTDAHNCKVIVNSGVVTLAGPVRSMRCAPVVFVTMTAPRCCRMRPRAKRSRTRSTPRRRKARWRARRSVGVAGETLGLLLGIGASAIPGLGPFIAAGPIVAALAGAGAGARSAR